VSALRVLPLGGLGEIGKNMTVLEYDERIVVVDTGLRFPTAEMLGIDLVLPDFSYLRERVEDIEAIVITHGHEDHIGGLPALVSDFRPKELWTGVTPDSPAWRRPPHLVLANVRVGAQGSGVVITEDGYVLTPHRMYLGHTVEVIGSDTYAMSLIGRSSMGRLGLFLQVSANLGHTTSCHCWTLEMVATRPLRVYPNMVIGQVSFWCNTGRLQPTEAFYARFDEPLESTLGGLR